MTLQIYTKQTGIVNHGQRVFDMDKEIIDSAIAFYRDVPTGQYDDEACEALEFLKANQWQPIETAPKGHGVKILCFEKGNENGDVYIAWRHKFNANRKSEFIGWKTIGQSEFWPNPTHWMPLPSPPR